MVVPVTLAPDAQGWFGSKARMRDVTKLRPLDPKSCRLVATQQPVRDLTTVYEFTS